MAAPTAPYATSAQVALFLVNLLKGGTDFMASTTPTKVAVDSIIGWVSSQIDMQLAAAGYKVPLAVMSGETWPTSQTHYLTLINCLGTAAFVGGHALKPAPAVAPGKEGGTGNLFQDLFNAQLKIIYNRETGYTAFRFRADYYPGTAAEEVLVLPSGPTLDFMAGKFDPTSYQNLWDCTNMVRKVQLEVKDLDIPWDYLYDYQNFQAGLGV